MVQLAVDIKMREYGITVAQFKKVMFEIDDLETVDETSVYGSEA